MKKKAIVSYVISFISDAFMGVGIFLDCKYY